MPIKYTVKYTLSDSAADVNIFNSIPAVSQELANFCNNLSLIVTERIENNCLIRETVFPNFTSYQSYMDLKPSLLQDRISWMLTNNIIFTSQTEYVE